MQSRIILGAVAALLLIVAAGLAAFFLSGRDTPTPMAAVPVAATPRMPPAMTFQPIFEPCAHCHEIGKGARTMTGPVLNGIVGRKAGTRDDYPYSAAMRESGVVWTEETLRRFLASPEDVAPGTRMRFGGLPEETIGPLIAFLKSAPAE